MAESFVLRLPAPGGATADAEWIVVDAAGVRVGDPARGTLAAAGAAAGGRRVIVLVPGTEVTLTAVELPSGTAGRLLRLVPFALEEQLAADVELLHFAVGRPRPDGRVPVAAVERARLADWLADLAAAGLAPAAVYPEALVVPDNPAHVVVFIDGGRVVVRAPDELPLTLDAAPLDAALAVAGLPPAAGAELPHVLVYAGATDWERDQAPLEALRGGVASLRVQLLADGALALLAAVAVANPPFSLLQGELTPRQGFAGEWLRWRTAASLAAAFLVLHLGVLGLDWWQLHRDERRADEALLAVAGEALPTVPNVGRLPSVRAAVDGRLRATRAAVSEGLLGTLGAVAAGVSAAPGTQLEAVSYREGVTELTVDAPDVGALDRLQQAAKGRGFDAQLQGATQREQRYQGHLTLRGPGS